MTSLAEPAPNPAAEDVDDGIALRRNRIDTIDGEIIDLLRQRGELAGQIQHLRLGSGGTRSTMSREHEVFRRYHSALGQPGAKMAHLVLAISRAAADYADGRARR